MFGAETIERARRACMALGLSLLCLTGACSLVVDPDVDSLGSPPRTCTPRDEAVCACLGGIQGIQVCNDGGSFDPCICGVAGAGG